jgi:alpha-glucosidase
MDFSKIPHPVNFTFPKQGKFPFKATLRDYGNGIWRLHINYNDSVKAPDESDLNPDFTAGGEDAAAGVVSFEKGRLRIFSPAGALLLESAREGFFGTEGDSWVMRFEQNAGDRFYGLGEKTGAFEKSGKRTLMWNVDAWGAHGMDVCRSGAPDPLYANIPYLLVRCKDEALGILVNDPAEVFFSLNPDMRLHPSQDPVKGSSFYFGATSGAPDIYFITGKDTASVIRKSGLLSGTFPRPPLWSLGYHQCRWGYSGTHDLEELDRRMTAAKIPCDGLWLDIDYMDKYKVFTTSPQTFADAEREMKKLRGHGRKVIAILDPGVRDERGYSVRESGRRAGVFCKNPNGDDYRGFVWPGATLFPDFSLAKTKRWWASLVRSFTDKGFSGYWLDMNDPSTGSVSQEDMRFGHGTLPHETYHNQYATGMAKATRAGLLESRPAARPFLLSRSGAAGSGKVAALWLGDNFSTWSHLRACVPMALGLSLSGVPMVGADVGGFGDDCSAELMARWVEATCLFPFFRIHSAKNVKRQEPWQFGPRALSVIRKGIRFRYRMLPYLYNVFLEHERTGAPVMRPLFYLGKSAAHIPDARLEDEFLIGGNVIVTPVLEQGADFRNVILPKGEWYSPLTDNWYAGEKPFRFSHKITGVPPVFFKEASLIPQFRKPCTTSTDDLDLARAELPVYLKDKPEHVLHFEYRYDSGEGFAYKTEGDKVIRIEVK